ncbi:ribose-phosphate pyrophosphokinase [Rickettsia rickettsii str. R]|nr:ribose-phosphate pyrophosphokinase [Rickettsia rickettsii str. R]AJG34352.1 ribose-phosphate pyrophosphokinase [Rickettsia rickettsii str. Morgan]
MTYKLPSRSSFCKEAILILILIYRCLSEKDFCIIYCFINYFCL